MRNQYRKWECCSSVFHFPLLEKDGAGRTFTGPQCSKVPLREVGVEPRRAIGSFLSLLLFRGLAQIPPRISLGNGGLSTFFWERAESSSFFPVGRAIGLENICNQDFR
jgi:hypothetical protein